jgi:hypothetical protein
MDPDAAFTALHDETITMDERADNAVALLEWLSCGGFRPDGVDHKTATQHALAVIAAA